jgi:hypothetical protein
LHALLGNAIALFLVEVLQDAVKEVSSISATEECRSLYAKLLQKQEEDYSRVLDKHIPSDLEIDVARIFNSDKVNDVAKATLFKSRAFCHTALNPAELRFRGLLTETNETAQGYDKGISEQIIIATENPTEFYKTSAAFVNEKRPGEMVLSYDPNRRQDHCPEPLQQDYRDFFRVSTAQGWQSLTLPNDSEISYFGIDPSQLQGIVIVCPTLCHPWRCDTNELYEDFSKQNVKIEVNKAPVLDLSPIDSCYFLKGTRGHYWKPNNEGRYTVRVRVDDEEHKYRYARLSSIIIL